MKIIDRVNKTLNGEFRECLKAYMLTRFAVEIETRWDLFSDRIISTRADEEPFTPEQMEHMQIFEAGYMAAWGVVSEMRR